MRPRQHYDDSLAALHHQLTELGALAANAVARSLNALANQDTALAHQIIADDTLIDAAERELQTHAVALIATQQPVARDLRSIIAAIGVGAELERIADYAKSIAKIIVGPEGAAPLEAPADLLQLGAAARAILDHALAALAAMDEAAAQALISEEEQIDRRYRLVKPQLAAALAESPLGPARAADLLFIAYSLERIADRATNIAERIIYHASGETVKLN